MHSTFEFVWTNITLFPVSFAVTGPPASSSSSLNSRFPGFSSSLFPSFPLSGSFFTPRFFLSFLPAASAIMFFHDDVVPSCPLLETMLSPGEVQELLSLIQAEEEDPSSPNSSSQGSNRAVYSLEERKRRRMQSNRESARRSRWRKKRHLENLTNQVNRLKTENRQLKNQLGLTLHQHLIVSLENAQLRSESEFLMTRLSHLYRAL